MSTFAKMLTLCNLIQYSKNNYSSGKLGSSNYQILKRKVLHPQHFHNIFTTNHSWLVVIGSNLNLLLRLFFAPIIIISNNLPLKICYENIVDIAFLF